MPSSSDRREFTPIKGELYKLRDPRDKGAPFEVVGTDGKKRHEGGKVFLKRQGGNRTVKVSLERFHSVTYEYEGRGTATEFGNPFGV